MVRCPPNAPRAVLGRCAAGASAIRRIWAAFTHAGVCLARTVSLSEGVEFKITDGGKLSIASDVYVGRGVSIHAQSSEISIGARTFVGAWTTIVACESIMIGSDCLIAERVTLRDQDHRIHGDPSLPIHGAAMDVAPIRIGNDVWVAAGAVVLKGVSLGDGAVVAANAVVRADVPARAIVAGVPARIVGYRREM